MTTNLYTIVAFWVAVAFLLGTVWAVVSLVAEERRIRRGEREWRAWFDALPETEKLAGAQRLWDAVSSTPIHDGLALEYAAEDLTDDSLREWLR